MHNAATDQYLYTVTPQDEGGASGFVVQGGARFHVFVDKGAGMVPLSRISRATAPATQLLTTAPDYELLQLVGPMGYVYPPPCPAGTVPIVRAHHNSRTFLFVPPADRVAVLGGGVFTVAADPYFCAAK